MDGVRQSASHGKKTALHEHPLSLPVQGAFLVSQSDGFIDERGRRLMLLVRPLSLWKYNWKSFGVLIVEPISSMLTVPRDEMPNMVPNFSAALATALSPS